MLKAFTVIFVVLAATLGLLSGVLTVGIGETSAPVVALAVVTGMFLAAPVAWRLLQGRKLG
ncbi:MULTISPECIES: hypothetical protein [unclassified Dinoroseobacter]|uniref:hypothetical protein n=1 Tax=unclassified Dinoroseobacter TaxID=2620028 RepID=UPI003C7B1FE7